MLNCPAITWLKEFYMQCNALYYTELRASHLPVRHAIKIGGGGLPRIALLVTLILLGQKKTL